MTNQQASIMAVGDVVEVNDRMQSGYGYDLVESVGRDFPSDFTSKYSPQKMLTMGVFEGKYCNDCTNEYPESWVQGAKTSPTPDPALNYFGVKSRQPLSVWQKKGWIYGPDPRGWFQWYCRYYLGRRLPEVDRIQIKRLKRFCPACRPDPRQLRPRRHLLPPSPAAGASPVVI